MSNDELRQRYLNNLETLLSAPRLLRQLSFDVETDGVPDDLSLDGGVFLPAAGMLSAVMRSKSDPGKL